MYKRFRWWKACANYLHTFSLRVPFFRGNEFIGSNNSRLEPRFRRALINDRRCVSAWLPLFFVFVEKGRVIDSPKVRLFFVTPNSIHEVFIQRIVRVDFCFVCQRERRGWKWTRIGIVTIYMERFQFGNFYTCLRGRIGLWRFETRDVRSVCSANRQIGMDRSSSRLQRIHPVNELLNVPRNRLLWRCESEEPWLWLPLWVHAHVNL